MKLSRKNIILCFILTIVNFSCSSTGGYNKNYATNVDEPEITDSNVKITLNNYTRWKIYGEDKLPKINKNENFDINKIKNITKKNNVEYNGNPVYISELDFNSIDAAFNKSKFPKLEIGKYKEKVPSTDYDKEHGAKVLDAFLDSNYSGEYDKNDKIDDKIDITMFDSEYFKTLKSDKQKYGIVNMSHGSTTFTGAFNRINGNYGYIDKGDKKAFFEMSEYISDLVQDEDYKSNRWLKIVSLGNSNDLRTRGKWYTSLMLSNYQISSPEIQKAMRSETILAKNSFYKGIWDLDTHVFQTTKKGKEVVEMRYPGNKFDSSALGLRSFTVGALGVNATIGREGIGSSYSSPRVTRLAYEIKKKFPYLTLHQVKEVILGTADHDKSGYLNNINGWGQVDYEKAMKGPSDFNAGLIDETKFFEGQPSKIFDEKGNRYFYVDTKGYNSTWENDIVSGLTGDGNNTEYEIYPILGTDTKKYKEEKAFRYKIPKVLDSEKLFYNNIATAGLRKDGKGELVLRGKQLYNNKIQVLDGILKLENNANSKEIDVFEKGILNLEDKNIIEINDIVSDGNVNFKTNVNLKDFRGSKSSKTTFKAGIKINANNVVLGKYSIGDIKNLEQLKGIIILKSGEINQNNLTNLYLKPIEKIENGVFVIDFEENGNYRKLNTLTKEELRNIPSYSLNENKFFEEYSSNEEFAYNRVESDDKKTTSVKIMNLESDDKELTKSQVFTDNYSTYAKNLFESNSSFENDRFNEYFKDQNMKNRVSVNSYNNINFVKGQNFTPFSKKFESKNLKYNHKLNNNLELGILASYLSTDYKFDNKSRFDSKGLSLGLNTINKLKNIDIITENILTYNNVDINRMINKDEVNSNLKSILSENTILVKKDIDFKNNVISPFVSNNFQILNIFENSGENNLDKNNDYSTKVLNTTLLNNKISGGVNIKTNITDKFSIENRLKLDVNLNTPIKLNVETMGQKYKAVGQKLDIFNGNYNLNLKYKVLDTFKINSNFDINTKGKFGAGISLDFEF